MASTLNIQRALNWTLPFLKNQPLDFYNQEPALTTGNIVLQTIMGPPFKYRFNRATFAITAVPASAQGVVPAVAAQSDYPMVLPDFGFLEDQWITSGTGATAQRYPLTGAFSLPMATGNPSRPTALAVHLDDGEGNLLFRLKETPDKAYVIGGTYQKKTPILKSLAQTIGPFPDEFAYIFHWGFLSISAMLVNDSRFPIWEKNFIGRLLGLQDGLDDVSRNIFLGLWEQNTKTMMRSQAGVQQGTAGRGA